MDTNINNYNINEILKLIKVSTETCILDNVYSVILTILQQIKVRRLRNGNITFQFTKSILLLFVINQLRYWKLVF